VSVRLEGVAWAAALVLAVGVVYEVFVATEIIPIGTEPGEGAPGAGIALVASLLALAIGSAVSFICATRPSAARAAVWALLPLAGAAYTVAHWTAFDPYYAPTLRRYSEGGVAGEWVAAVVLAAAMSAGAATLTPRPGALLGALVLLVEAFTVVLMPFGK
jgi:hypothetical protein